VFFLDFSLYRTYQDLRCHGRDRIMMITKSPRVIQPVRRQIERRKTFNQMVMRKVRVRFKSKRGKQLLSQIRRADRGRVGLVHRN
jgi:hypothetical protein